MRKYDDEFKREAIRKIHEGQSVASVARELGCAESLLHNWKRQAVEVSSDAEREVLALRGKLREVEIERDILKKAALTGELARQVHQARCRLGGRGEDDRGVGDEGV
jgi:transposase